MRDFSAAHRATEMHERFPGIGLNVPRARRFTLLTGLAVPAGWSPASPRISLIASKQESAWSEQVCHQAKDRRGGSGSFAKHGADAAQHAAGDGDSPPDRKSSQRHPIASVETLRSGLESP